jgi:hypothetical protein
MRKSQKGFAVVEIFLVAAVLVAVGLIGYRVVSNHNTKASNENSTGLSDQSKTSANSVTVPEINKTSDLDKAQTTLNQSDSSSDDQRDSGTLNNSDDF